MTQPTKPPTCRTCGSNNPAERGEHHVLDRECDDSFHAPPTPTLREAESEFKAVLFRSGCEQMDKVHAAARAWVAAAMASALEEAANLIGHDKTGMWYWPKGNKPLRRDEDAWNQAITQATARIRALKEQGNE
jgi:hypothetical protein